MEKTICLLDEDFTGLCFTNLVDFDALYGHRRDLDGYKLAIEEFGLFEYEDFANYVSKEEFDSYPTKYLKISMARGLMTWEDIEYLITRYCNK